MTLLTSLEELFVATMRLFRTEPPEGYSFSNLTDFSDPTQIYGVELTSGSARHVSILIAHDQQVEDGRVEIRRVDGAEGLATLAGDAGANFGYRPLPPQYRFPWTTPERTAVESMLLQARELLGLERAIEPREVLVARQQMVQTVPAGSLIGLLVSPAELPTPDALLRSLGTERRPLSVQQEQVRSLPVPMQVMASAIYSYPPVWFGAPPFPSTADLIRGKTLREAVLHGKDEVVARGDVSGIETVVTRRGLVACVTSDATLGLQLANTVLAVLARSGIPQEAGAADDLLAVTNWRDADPPGDHSTQLTVRNRSRDRFAPAQVVNPDSWFHVQVQAADAILQAAAKTAEHSDLSKRALRLFDAQTLAQRSHHTEAFIVSWSLIEDWVARAFEQFWQGRGRSNRRIREDAPVWTAKQRLDLLVAARTVDDEVFSLLDRLRRKRNAVVHRLEQASAEDASLCFGAASSLLDLPRVEVTDAGTFHV